MQMADACVAEDGNGGTSAHFRMPHVPQQEMCTHATAAQTDAVQEWTSHMLWGADAEDAAAMQAMAGDAGNHSDGGRLDRMHCAAVAAPD